MEIRPIFYFIGRVFHLEAKSTLTFDAVWALNTLPPEFWNGLSHEQKDQNTERPEQTSFPIEIWNDKKRPVGLRGCELWIPISDFFIRERWRVAEKYNGGPHIFLPSTL